MFQTIGHKGGFIQLTTIGNKTTIKAYLNGGELLGDKYTTVAGAKAAITRRHKAWRREADSLHHRVCFGLFDRL
jgi:hypothetical protein